MPATTPFPTDHALPRLNRRHWLGLAAATLGNAALGQPGQAPGQAPAARDALIANGWPAHASVLIMLGAGRRIAATVNRASQRPWMYAVAPTLHQAIQAPVGGFVAEALLARGVRLAFVTPADTSAAALQAAGIQVVKTIFQDFASMRDSVQLTARTLGGDAPERAHAYLAHLDAEVARLRRWGQTLAEHERPRVVHVAQWAPTLLVDGGGTLIDEWIRAAGGRNAAAGIQGSLRPVTMEQLLQWNPDVLIEAARSADQRRPPGYEALAAVREQRVLRNPEGVFPWDRYGCEITLQLHWAASQLHPAKMPGHDMAARVQDFYRRFFDHPLDEHAARRILAGQPPG